jgi:periplasmic protein CpxP/Spy
MSKLARAAVLYRQFAVSLHERTRNRHYPAGFPLVLEEQHIMQKTLSTLALAGLLSLAGSAALGQDNAAPPPPQQGQGYGHHGMNPEAQLQHLTKQLDLTAQQQSQIKPILEDRDTQMKQVWQDQSLAPQDRHAKVKALQEDSRSKIEAVLNDTQKQKYEAMLTKMQERHGQMQGGEAAPQQQ